MPRISTTQVSNGGAEAEAAAQPDKSFQEYAACHPEAGTFSGVEAWEQAEAEKEAAQ